MLSPGNAEKKVHQGRNIKRIREILGIKQDALAYDLGLSQQAISQLEQKEVLEQEMLEKVANALKISPEAIKNFSEEVAINIIQHNYEGSTNNYSGNYYCTFNPIDKIVELYEELLKSEREKIELLKTLKK